MKKMSNISNERGNVTHYSLDIKSVGDYYKLLYVHTVNN